MKILSRRTFLRGVVGGTAVTLALPPLEAMLAPRGPLALADSSEPILGIFYWANGLPWHGAHGAMQGGRPDLWTPSGGDGYTPSELLTDLAPYQPCVATGLTPHTAIPDTPPGQGDEHMRGFMVALTSDRPRSHLFNHESHTLTALRPSLNQYVAKETAFYATGAPRFRSLVMGVSEARFHDYGHWNAISYNGPDSVNLPMMQPSQLYNALFSVPADAEELARRSRLLDAVLDDARSLRRRLGASDRHRLDDHLAHLDEIKRRLDIGAGTCMAPAPPSDAGNLIQKTETMAELLSIGLDCGLTRVFSFMLTSPATTHIFANVPGVVDGMHKVCHDGSWDQVRAITRYQMQAFARFLAVLQRHTDATGVSLLDRACILGLSEYGEGWQHSVAEMPAVLAGGACGRLRRMVHVREPGGNFSKVHVTALRAIGLTVAGYGFNDGDTTEHLTGVLV